ncbi:chitinase [Cellulosimicrobium cellulans]|uniref:chitinase n=1 Tax=Cellulosimicrobium cellulans TaxID=1710 RepID=UPI0035E061D5
MADPTPSLIPTTHDSPPASGPAPTFVVTEQQFDAMFPERNPFYTYAGLVAATAAYPAFATTGGDRVARREAAAFLANVSHETHGLVHVVEVNTANYPHYCDPSQPYGCPAGQDAYYGRGPLQLSWNFNYRAAGEALGVDLLADPWLVEQDPTVAWQTALWYWNTQPGTASMTCHEAIVGEHGFAETIRSINGPLECEGGNPRQMNNRVRLFRHYVEIVGTTTGDHLTC